MILYLNIFKNGNHYFPDTVFFNDCDKAIKDSKCNPAYFKTIQITINEKENN